MRIGPIELLSVDTDKKDKRRQKELGKKLMRWWWRWRDDLRHCILLGPLLGVLVVDGAIGLVDARDLGHERIVWVRVAQEWAYGEEHFGDGERRRPLRAQYVQTDAAVAVYVRVVDARRECDLAERETVFIHYSTTFNALCFVLRSTQKKRTKVLPIIEFIVEMSTKIAHKHS